MAVFHLARDGRLGWMAAAMALSATAAPALAAPPRDAVAQAEEARLHAEISHDVPGLERLVAPDLWYIHANGRTQDRAAYLAAIAKGDSPVYDMRLAEREIAVDGRMAVTHGTIDYLVRTDSRPRRARFAAVYRRARAGWQLVSWQNTAVPEAK